MYKIIAGLCVMLSIAIGVLWLSKGMHLATPEQIQITTVTVDDFGDEVKNPYTRVILQN